MRSVLFSLVSTAALCLGPADTARSETPAPHRIVEIVTFRLINGVPVDQFLAASKGTEAALRGQPGFIARRLVQTPDGAWTDLVEWNDLETAKAAAEAVMQDPAFGPFMALIDPDTVALSHGALMWRMD